MYRITTAVPNFEKLFKIGDTGAVIYSSMQFYGKKGWFKVGGTSLSASLIAGVFALSGNYYGSADSLPYVLGDYKINLRDITEGNNGSCGGLYLYEAVSGYDGPTGLGNTQWIINNYQYWQSRHSLVGECLFL